MHSTLITTAFLAAASLASAFPHTSHAKIPTNFLLVTTSSGEPKANSSLLPAVSATSLFDPYYQTNFLLRLIGPGYGSLPRFNLTSGTLESLAAGPHGIGEFEYNSTVVRTGEELQFAPSKQPAGNLGLRGGYLLTVGGVAEGWKVCDGELEQSVVSPYHVVRC